MARKIIIDCDPGISDAVAICMALFDPRLEVLAITATAGVVAAERATINVRGLVGLLDPPRYPRIGVATPSDHAPVEDDNDLHGPDGLGGCELNVTDRQHQHPSEKVIAELLRLHPGQITLLCCGPLTNLARVLHRDPTLTTLIDKVVISGGTFLSPGNRTPAAEANMHYDPPAARDVFLSATTKSLIPLDVTDQVSFGIGLLELLPSKLTRVGGLLHRLLPYSFRATHEYLGSESITLADATALLAVLEPDLFRWREMAGDVETQGRLTRGTTVFDRRARQKWKHNMEVATDVDVTEARERIVRGLRYAAQQS
ncbi:MAG: nucleoside hydrolase [Planctomycetaceae bacterium]|nr:MAG: nucleoside hydrolase [Planctomycetaceae bacterium]